MEAHPVLEVMGADTLPWEQLPLLIQVMTLEKLPFKEQLKFRLVCKEMKKEVEKILRKKQIFHAFKWLPDSFMDFHQRECLCVYDMLKKPYDTPDQPTPHVKYPPALESATDNPFPTASLLLMSELGAYSNMIPDDAPQLPHPLEDLFVSFGVYLNVLTLYELEIKCSTLVGILENTPNIKVLRMNTLTISETQHVKRYSNTFSRNLPSLPRLESLVLDNLNAFTTEHGPYGQNSCSYLNYEYFYQSYTSQLVKLVINCGNDADLMSPLKAPFPKLKSLSLDSPPKSFLINSAPPTLVDLVILGKDFDRELMPNFYDVIRFTDKFSDTLVHLCLNIAGKTLQKD